MSTHFTLSKHRLDPLIDAVFGVAMTILALEIKVPELHHPGSAAELFEHLGHHASTIGVYFVSFALLGMFWVWHHRLSDKVRQIDGVLLACTLFFLSLVCLFPFAAALFGRYIVHGNVGTLLVYLPVLGLILLSQVAFLGLAIRRKLLRDDFTHAQVMAAHRHNLFSLAAFTLSCIPALLIVGIVAASVAALLGGLLIWFGIRAR